jgi:hypothetical protein
LKGSAVNEKEKNNEPFTFTLVTQCLEEDRDESLSPDELSDKELFSTFAFIIVAVAMLALTLGPFSLLK